MSCCQLICPNLRCRKILKVPGEARGKIVRCQYCQTLLRVPAPAGSLTPDSSTATPATTTKPATPRQVA